MVYDVCAERVGFLPEGDLKKRLDEGHTSGDPGVRTYKNAKFYDAFLGEVDPRCNEYTVQIGKCPKHEKYMLIVCAETEITAEQVIQTLMHKIGFQVDTSGTALVQNME